MNKPSQAPIPAWARHTEDGWLFSIRVQPGARRSQVLGSYGDELKVSIAAPAVDDKANAALIKFLAKALEVNNKAVTLVGGHKSRSKRVQVANTAALDRFSRLLP